MKWAIFSVLTFWFLIICVVVGLIIYFIVRRIQKKEKETFERRDN